MRYQRGWCVRMCKTFEAYVLRFLFLKEDLWSGVSCTFVNPRPVKSPFMSSSVNLYLHLLMANWWEWANTVWEVFVIGICHYDSNQWPYFKKLWKWWTCLVKTSFGNKSCNTTLTKSFRLTQLNELSSCTTYRSSRKQNVTWRFFL